MAAPSNISGPSSFSVLKDAYKAIFSRNLSQSQEHHTFTFQQAPGGVRSLERDFGRQECSTELHCLIDVLHKVRQRILTNTFLRGSLKWWTWVLIGLIAFAAVSVKLTAVITLAAVLVVAGTAVILTWIWRTRLSIYDTACRVDSAAGLHDRLSTAIFLGDAENPDEMMHLQREDALGRLGKVKPHGLFPIRMPSSARRSVVIVLAAAGLLAYRIHHKPPLVSLLETTERSQLVQSMLSPIVHAMERDLQRAMAFVTKPEDTADEVRAGDITPPPDDLWQNSDDKQNNLQSGQQNTPEAGDEDQQQDQSQSSGNQNGPQSAGSQQQQNGGHQSQGNNNNGTSTGKPGQMQESKETEGQKQSLGESLMQALKSMMSNSQTPPSNNKGNQDSQQSNAQGSPQPGNANASNPSENNQKGESRGSSEAQQKASKSASNGAGSQEGLKQTRTDSDSHQVTAVPDRVALETNKYKEQIRMQMDPEAGTAQMATRNVSAQAMAVVNGAEQENIPPRYRLYVQRYFEHTVNGQQENGQQDNSGQ